MLIDCYSSVVECKTVDLCRLYRQTDDVSVGMMFWFEPHCVLVINTFFFLLAISDCDTTDRLVRIFNSRVGIVFASGNKIFRRAKCFHKTASDHLRRVLGLCLSEYSEAIDFAINAQIIVQTLNQSLVIRHYTSARYVVT